MRTYTIDPYKQKSYREILNQCYMDGLTFDDTSRNPPVECKVVDLEVTVRDGLITEHYKVVDVAPVEPYTKPPKAA